jgi:hypothetical protein
MARRINAKLVLELLGRGMSGREIYRTRRIAQQSVKKVREAAEEKGVTWEDVNLMGNRRSTTYCSPSERSSKPQRHRSTMTTCTRSCSATVSPC